MASGVEFEEDSLSHSFSRPSQPMGASGRNFNVPTTRQAQYDNSGSKMGQWLVRHHLAKSPHSAQFILIAVILINIVITFVVFFFFT